MRQLGMFDNCTCFCMARENIVKFMSERARDNVGKNCSGQNMKNIILEVSTLSCNFGEPVRGFK